MENERAREMLKIATEVAREFGLSGVTRPRIAEQAGCSAPLISHYWGPLSALIDAVVKQAVEREDLPVLAWAVIECHPIAMAAPIELRERAALSIVGR